MWNEARATSLLARSAQTPSYIGSMLEADACARLLLLADCASKHSDAVRQVLNLVYIFTTHLSQ
jgi:hypothetical protein